jgi:uncharacterized protein YndB with AHSA1/START domain
MGFFIRALKILMVLLLLAAVVLWFAARRGDRGYFVEEVTIDRSAPVVFRWLTTDALLRRWISDLIKLEKIESAGAPEQLNYVYRIDQIIGTRAVSIHVKILRAIPNQELQLAVRPADESAESFIGNAEFKLLPNGDYTRVVFSSQTEFESLSDQIFEPILTYATQRNLREDLSRLKLMIEAEPRSQSYLRVRAKD